MKAIIAHRLVLQGQQGQQETEGSQQHHHDADRRHRRLPVCGDPADGHHRPPHDILQLERVHGLQPHQEHRPRHQSLHLSLLPT